MILQTWKMAVGAVAANKLRTFLTMLGIIIGVMSLIILVSLAGGATSSVTSQISEMGSNYLSVRITDDKENPLRWSEFQELLQDETIEEAAPFYMTSMTGKSGYTSETINIYGTTGDYFRIMDLGLQSGRLIKQTDQDNHTYVIMITADTATEYFGHPDAVGEYLSLDGRSFLVIGILESGEQTQMMLASDSEEETAALEGYIPYSTMTRVAEGILDITQFYVSSTSEESLNQTETAVNRILLERLENDDEAFEIQNQSEVLETVEEVDHTMNLMLAGIAAISLLVGGLGIMNIMLVSVTERTREIGIRKAIGAGKGSILLQFLMEAVIVSLAGCFLGIVFSWIALQAAANILADSMTIVMDWKITLTAVAFSAVTGIVFGLYPAGKAAAKKPIDALRYS
ncbi:MAG: ABC transporter permease [Ruminococcus sp.]|jgi:putative ABC transport system permease protein